MLATGRQPVVVVRKDCRLSEEKLKYAENIMEGFENTPREFIG